jgi:tRNA pseudouridine55 synthase
MMLSGLLNLDKPSGLTSRDVVNQIVRITRRVKAGHAGTLDPLASGVLVVAVGSATRLIECVQRMPKCYRTVIRLGARSDTLDLDGTVIEEANPPIPSLEGVRRAVLAQVGEIRQLPPEYSALKVNGRRAHELAREGQVVELLPRRVRIDRITVLDYEWPELTLEVECGGGTYIRSIARDVGEALGCGGLVQSLVRTRIGTFTLQDAVAPGSLTRDNLSEHLRPSQDAVPDLPRLCLDDVQGSAILQGRTLDASGLPGAVGYEGEAALIATDGRMIALGELDPTRRVVRPLKVLG